MTDDVFPLPPSKSERIRLVPADAVDARDRVIARLLDGWLFDIELQEWHWFVSGISVPPEPMSDGEAAIIRQHQEKMT